MLSADIDDASLDGNGQPMPVAKPEGWSAREFRIAQDSRRSGKNEPAYLARATRILESYTKREADKPQAPTLNATVQVYVAQSVRVYPVMDVTDEER